MPGFITTADGVSIFSRTGAPRDAQPIMVHHGWPLSADDWDGQVGDAAGLSAIPGLPEAPPAGSMSTAGTLPRG